MPGRNPSRVSPTLLGGLYESPRRPGTKTEREPRGPLGVPSRTSALGVPPTEEPSNVGRARSNSADSRIVGYRSQDVPPSRPPPGARELPAPGQALVVVEAVEGRQEKRPGLLRRGKGSESLTTCSRGPTSTRGRVVRAVSLMGLTGAYAATIGAGQASDGLSALPRSACVNIPASACGAPPDRRLPRRDEPATHPVPCPPKVGRPWRLVAHLSSSASVPRAGATAPRCPSLSANRGRRRTRVVTKRGD